LNVTIKQLRAFVAVSETGSFTRAADRLFVTQSALSVIIRELEFEVGLRLLDRTTRMVVLTAAGREFLKSATRVLSDLECAIRDAREVVARQHGQVILGVPPLAAATFIPDMIVKLKAAHSEIGVILRDLRPDEIAASAATGEIDFGLGTFDETSEPLRRTVVARQPFTVTCAPDHPLAALPSVRWADLPGFPLITIARDHTVRRLLDHTFGHLGRNTFPAYEVYHALTAVGMVVAGLGIAVFPQWVGLAAQLYDVSIREIEQPTVMSELALISHPDREFSPAMKQFESFFSSYIAGMNWSTGNNRT
jgi:DNA-binding transcriptional LysR family regulator